MAHFGKAGRRNNVPYGKVAIGQMGVARGEPRWDCWPAAWCHGRLTPSLRPVRRPQATWPPRPGGPIGAAPSTTARCPAGPPRWFGAPPVPPGVSTPVVWDRAVFLTAQQGSQLELLQLDLMTGKLRWKQTLGTVPTWPKGAEPPGGWPWPQQSWAAPGPATDGQVVAALGSHGLLSVHQVQDGRQRWFRRIGPAKTQLWPSLGGVLLWQDRVIVLRWLGGPGEVPTGHLAAFDKWTGRELWHVALLGNRAAKPVLLGTSPALGRLHDRPVVLVLEADQLRVFAPEDGKQLLGYRLGAAQSAVASPFLADQTVVACHGTGGPLLGLEYFSGRRGPVLRRLWRRQVAPPLWATPARWRDLVFAVSQNGQARCIHLPTGKTYWQRPLRGTFYASPVAADGRVYFLSYEGTCFVAAASGNYRLLARNRLPDRFVASPAVAAAHLFLRGKRRLYCVGPYLDQNR